MCRWWRWWWTRGCLTLARQKELLERHVVTICYGRNNARNRSPTLLATKCLQSSSTITHTSNQNLNGKHVGGTSELPQNAHALRLEPEPLTLRSVDLVAEGNKDLVLNAHLLLPHLVSFDVESWAVRPRVLPSRSYEHSVERVGR